MGGSFHWNQGQHVYVLVWQLLLLSDIASFPGSTPQLFSYSVEKHFSILCKKSWGVEPGNEASKIIISLVM